MVGYPVGSAGNLITLSQMRVVPTKLVFSHVAIQYIHIYESLQVSVMNYTVLALVTAAALIAAATLAANTPTEIFAVHKLKTDVNDNGCPPTGEKDDGVPEKCGGFIDRGHDDVDDVD